MTSFTTLLGLIFTLIFSPFSPYRSFMTHFRSFCVINDCILRSFSEKQQNFEVFENAHVIECLVIQGVTFYRGKVSKIYPLYYILSFHFILFYILSGLSVVLSDPTFTGLLSLYLTIKWSCVIIKTVKTTKKT